MKSRRNAGFTVRHPVTDFELHHLAPAVVVEFESAVERVGRFLIVVVHEVPANGADLHRVLHAQAPSRDIHFVDALIAEVAVAGIPEPVPVVVEAIEAELTLWRRSGPQIVIDAGGNGSGGRVADGVAPLEAQAAGEINIAE